MSNTPLNDALKPCPLCSGKVEFHEEYPHCDGCHHIYCPKCGMFDLSTAADPLNQCETIDLLREKIIPVWNTRARTPESSAAQGAMTELDRVVLENCVMHLRDYQLYEAEKLVRKFLLSQPSDATAQPNATTQRELDGWKENAKYLERSLSDLRNALAMHQQRTNNDYWIYVGDGEDHIESMSNEMAVLISAGKLRALLANTAQGKTDHIGDVNGMVDLHQAFQDAMDKAGYDIPQRGKFKDSDYMYARDADRFAGFEMGYALAAKKG